MRQSSRYVFAAIVVCGLYLVAIGWLSWTPRWVNGLRGPVPNYPLSESDDDDAIKGVERITNLTFVMGWGSGLRGYETLELNENGNGRFLFNKDFRHAPWRLTSFKVSTQQVNSLKQTLMEIDFFSLKTGYYADIHDGSQWFVKVSCDEGKKGVYCNNHFPAPIVRLSDYLRKQIVPAAQGTPWTVVTTPLDTWREMTGGSESFDRAAK